jgi:membrane fusion protein (multidrug efflux system)
MSIRITTASPDPFRTQLDSTPPNRSPSRTSRTFAFESDRRPDRIEDLAPWCLGGSKIRNRIWLATLLFAIACGREPPPPEATAAPQPARLDKEEVVTVERGTVEAGPLVSGTLEAANTANLIARLGGAVRQVGPELGQPVAKGALLAKIDPGPLGAAAASGKAQAASARAALDVARREVERTRALVEAGALPRRDLEQAESRLTAQQAAVDQAAAQLATSQEQLADATIRAPFAGVVAKRGVTTGDVVAPGALLYQVIDPSSLRLSASVPSDQLGALRLGAPVRFTVRGVPEKTFAGTITRIAPAADPATRQIPILVELPNPSRALLAGLYAEGRIAAASETGLVIPASAITGEREPAVLRISKTGTIERVPVTLGLRDPLRDRAIVTRGLAEGDRIVMRANVAPPAGTPIEIPTS